MLGRHLDVVQPHRPDWRIWSRPRDKLRRAPGLGEPDLSWIDPEPTARGLEQRLRAHPRHGCGVLLVARPSKSDDLLDALERRVPSLDVHPDWPGLGERDSGHVRGVADADVDGWGRGASEQNRPPMDGAAAALAVIGDTRVVWRQAQASQSRPGDQGMGQVAAYTGRPHDDDRLGAHRVGRSREVRQAAAA